MATLTVRGLDEQLKSRLRIRAARHGRSMEGEVREILREVLTPGPSSTGLGTRIHTRFATIGGADLETVDRTDAPRAAVFEP